jgi:hypothetical protein
MEDIDNIDDVSSDTHSKPWKAVVTHSAATSVVRQ